jgi:hypothetical protein
MKYEPIFWDIETTGLNPMAQAWWNNTMAAQVHTVAFGRIHNWRDVEDWEDAEMEVTVLKNDSEYMLLQEVADKVANIRDGCLTDMGVEPFFTGFNSRNFDHPYISARFGRLRLGCPGLNHSLKRLDVQRAVQKRGDFSKNFPSQNDVAQEHGIPVNTDLTGEDMPRAFERRDWDKIVEHVEDDLNALMSIFVEYRKESVSEFYDHYDEIKGDLPTFADGRKY